MKKICYSSEVYKLDPRDLRCLEDASAAGKIEVEDEVVVLIGDDKLKHNDTLLCGRSVVEKAVAEGLEYISVRIAFIPRTKRFDFISPIIRSLRYKYRTYSTNVYHIDPREIRDLGIERGRRNSDNAYQFSNPKWALPSDEAKRRYEALKESMSKGYDDKFPIDIMLCRNFGVLDNVNQGHHRMSVAMELGLPRIAIMFSAVGQSPKFLHPLFRLLAKVSMMVK